MAVPAVSAVIDFPAFSAQGTSGKQGHDEKARHSAHLLELIQLEAPVHKICKHGNNTYAN
jgi:hypothetical protein